MLLLLLLKINLISNLRLVTLLMIELCLLNFCVSDITCFCFKFEESI